MNEPARSPRRTVKCAVPSCPTRLATPAASVFCRKHWQQLPLGLRTQVDELVALYPGEECTRQAIEAAVDEIHQQWDVRQD